MVEGSVGLILTPRSLLILLVCAWFPVLSHFLPHIPSPCLYSLFKIPGCYLPTLLPYQPSVLLGTEVLLLSLSPYDSVFTSSCQAFETLKPEPVKMAMVRQY